MGPWAAKRDLRFIKGSRKSKFTVDIGRLPLRIREHFDVKTCATIQQEGLQERLLGEWLFFYFKLTDRMSHGVLGFWG